MALSLNVGRGDTILSIKLKIFDKKGFPSEQQTLVFAGMKLQDELTLIDYKVQMESTLYLVIRQEDGENKVCIKLDENGKTCCFNFNSSDTVFSVK